MTNAVFLLFLVFDNRLQRDGSSSWRSLAVQLDANFKVWKTAGPLPSKSLCWVMLWIYCVLFKIFSACLSCFQRFLKIGQISLQWLVQGKGRTGHISCVTAPGLHTTFIYLVSSLRLNWHKNVQLCCQISVGWDIPDRSDVPEALRCFCTYTLQSRQIRS